MGELFRLAMRSFQVYNSLEVKNDAGCLYIATHLAAGKLKRPLYGHC
jgi:hypothetical protein